MWWTLLSKSVDQPTVEQIQEAQKRLKDQGSVYRIPVVPLHAEASFSAKIYLKFWSLHQIMSQQPNEML